ncbi:MAG TPA: PAS domain S-box protein [Stellaceae bacterium]|nr:PAS domain S-box protein [Stellaceae bacterium]
MLACFSLIGAEILHNFRARAAAIAESQGDATNLARSIAQHAEDTVQTADTILLELVERLEVDGAGPLQRARLSELLVKRIRALPMLSGLFIYDETGDLLASSVDALIDPSNNADGQYFQLHKLSADRGVHVGTPISGRSPDHAVIPISRRFDHADGSFAGVVAAVVDVDYFQRYYMTFDIGREGAISLTRSDGLLMVHRPFGEGGAGTSFPSDPAFAEGSPRRSVGSFEGHSGIDGITRLVSYHVVDRYGLIAFVALSKSEVLAQWIDASIRELIRVAILATVIGLLGLRLTAQIRQRQEAEKSVREMADTYRVLTDASADVILRTDLSGLRQYVSPASMEMLGYRPEELIGLPSFGLTHPDDMPEQKKIISALVAGQVETTSHTYRLRHKQGHWVWVETKFRLLRDPVSGEPVARVSAVRDITDRHNAEQAMRDSEARHRAMADSVSDLIIRVDRNGRRQYVSAASREILGYEPEELLGDRQINFAHPEDRANVASAYRALLAGKEIPPFVTARAVRKDGTIVWLEARNSVIHNASGELVEYVSVLRDVSRQRAIEEQLERARREAEAASQAKSEFLANMSHEIRTPMNGILGMNGLLLNSGLNTDQQKYAEAVRLSAEALLAIINDILDLSKLEAGKIELETLDFSMEDVVDEAIELLAPKAHQKALTLTAYVAPAARHTLLGDSARLRQVLLNLLSNAVKFTDHGFVAIEVSGQSMADATTKIRLDVRDTGIGLADTAREKLFQKFQQADGSITRRFGGTGLGLTISKQLIELMGGKIGVESDLGDGSVFWIELTLPRVAMARQPADGRSEAALAGRRALVVDEIEANRQILRRQLDADGMLVDAVGTAAMAVAALRQADASGCPFEVLLVDPSVPGLSAPAILDMVRHAALRPPRLVLMTALGLPDRTDPTIRAAFAAQLTKPIRHRDLTACLARLLAPQSTEASQPNKAQLSKTTGRHDTESAAAAKPVSPVETDPSPRGKHVLVAEDNEINRLLVTTLLKSAGYRVDTANDGLLAIEAVRAGAYDLILMDVQMPHADGVQATRAIRGLADGRGTMPILALTANAMAGDRESYLRAGMNDYLSKPLDAVLLLRMVADWIGKDCSLAEDGVAAASPPPVPDIPPILDMTVIEDLRAIMPSAKFDTIVADYVEWGRQHIAKFDPISSAEPSADTLASFAHLAHDLKGSSGTLGAKRLSSIAQRLETACLESQPATVAAILAELRIAADETWNALRQWLPPAATTPKHGLVAADTQAPPH